MAELTANIDILLIDEPRDAHRIDAQDSSIEELAASIKKVGLINPIMVRPIEGGRYELIAGHRRYLAHRRLGADTIRAIIVDADDDLVRQYRFAENLERTDLSPMEEARAIQMEMERTGHEVRTIALRINRSEWWVRERLALLEMPAELQELVHRGELPAAVCRHLAKVTDDNDRAYYTEYARQSGASAAVVREWVERWQVEKAQDPGAPAPRPVMPAEAGQPVIVQIPCYVCGEATPHTDTIIVRVCPACHEARTTLAQEGR